MKCVIAMVGFKGDKNQIGYYSKLNGIDGMAFTTNRSTARIFDYANDKYDKRNADDIFLNASWWLKKYNGKGLAFINA